MFCATTHAWWQVPELPGGTVTLLWVDLEDSGGPAGLSPEAFRDVMAGHRELVREAVEGSSGQEVDSRGTEILVVFVRARDAVDAAAAIVQAHQERGGGGAVDVRVALHTGEPIAAEGGYLGLDVHRVVRICGAGHGGQILLSQTVESLVRDSELPGSLVDLGEVELRGVPRPERVYQLSLPGLPSAFPPLVDRSQPPGGKPRLQPAEGALRVVLAEDSVLLREGMAVLLENQGFDVVGQAGDPDDLLLKVRSYTPDVAIVDVRMPPTHTDEGLRAAQEIRAKHPAIGVLVLSQYVEPAYAVELLAENAAGVGYLLKDRVNDVKEFAEAVRRVAAGGTAFDPQVVSELVGRRRRDGALDVLSAREREVLELMAEGRSNQAISEQLYLSSRAVERHVTSIFNKLRLPATAEDNRRVLAVLAFLQG
jgi:DNA-binding NarL/FixJ family response regulator/class 3 adenylate cyclase